MNVKREEVLTEIVKARERYGRYAPIFVGVNNKALLSDGTRIEGSPLLRIFSGEDWVHELRIYAAADLKVKAIEIFKGELTQLVTISELGENPIAIRYYGLQLNGGCWGQGEPVKDLRACILPEILTGTLVTWPFIYIYAELSELDTNNPKSFRANHTESTILGGDNAVRVLAEGLKRDIDDTTDTTSMNCEFSNDKRYASPMPRRRQASNVQKSHNQYATAAASAAAAAASVNNDDKKGSAYFDLRTARDLEVDAKQAALCGDHKNAYELMTRAMRIAKSTPKITDQVVETAHESDFAPMKEVETNNSSLSSENFFEPKTFRPAVVYRLASGETHVIPPGMYTENEFFQKTLEAQELVSSETKRAPASSLKPQSMSEYSDAFTQSDSACEAMESSECFKDQIVYNTKQSPQNMKLSKDLSPLHEPTPPPVDAGNDFLVVDIGRGVSDLSFGK